MILVAGTALGLSLTRRFSSENLLAPFDPIGPMSSRWGSPWTARDWATWTAHTALNRFDYLSPLLLGLTGTVLALRMRTPRPRLARLMRQPGAIAGMTVISSLVLSVPSSMGWNISIIAYAVGSSWLILLVGGRWQGEAGWIDRSGRLLGVMWLAPIPLLFMINLLNKYL